MPADNCCAAFSRNIGFSISRATSSSRAGWCPRGVRGLAGAITRLRRGRDIRSATRRKPRVFKSPTHNARRPRRAQDRSTAAGLATCRWRRPSSRSRSLICARRNSQCWCAGDTSSDPGDRQAACGSEDTACLEPRRSAKISVFLTGSFGYGKKWQSQIEKRPHYRQTVEETIAQRLTFMPTPALGVSGGVQKPRGGARSGGVKNAIIVRAARCLVAKVVRVTDGKPSPAEFSLVNVRPWFRSALAASATAPASKIRSLPRRFQFIKYSQSQCVVTR